MHLITQFDTTEPEPRPSGRRDAPRAGLRQQATGAEPTGTFVVIEMTVLVLVAALAMVAIIVSGEDGRVRVEAASRAPVDARAQPAAPQRFDARATIPGERRMADADVRPR